MRFGGWQVIERDGAIRAAYVSRGGVVWAERARRFPTKEAAAEECRKLNERVR